MQAVRKQPLRRSVSQDEETPDILVPALAQLRKCSDSMDVLIHIEEHWPDRLLPALAWAASRKTFIPHIAVQTLVKYCGPLQLERCLGRTRARELQARVVR